MLNMLDTQDKLKNFSEQQLIQEMQMPTGSAPQFMVLGEIERRKRMRADMQRQEGLMQPTVAQEAVSAAGVPQQGIAQVAQSLAPQTDMTQNTGVPNVQAAGLPAQPNQPVKMAKGGDLSGGTITAIANLKTNYPQIYATVKDDPSALRMAARYALDVAKDPTRTGLESLETPRDYDFLKRMFTDPSNRAVSRNQRAIADAQPDYSLAQRAKSLSTLRNMPEDDPAFAEGMPREFVPGTTGPTPGVIPADTMFTAPAMPSGDLSYAINPALDGVVMPAPDMGVKTPSGFGENPMPAPSMDAAPDVSQLTDEQARRLYLSGRDYEESDVPAIVDMLNRGREFQQGDTYTPPEEIYDLGPRGRLKYEMEGASPLEMNREFSAVSNRLAGEATADERAKEERFFTAQDIAADAAKRQPIGPAEEIVMSQPVEVAAGSDTGTPLQVPAGGIADILPDPEAARAASIQDKAAAIEAAATGSGGTGSGSAAPAKKSGIEAAKGKMDQDKWLALAQAGFELMSSGDFGKAGQAGLASLQQAKQNEMAERKLDAELLLREAQLAAANRRGTSTGSALTPNQLLSRGNDLIKSGQSMLEAAGDNADAAAEAQSLILAGRNLIRQVTGGAATSEAGAIKLPSAG